MIDHLRKERDTLEKTARFFHDKKRGVELHNEQLEQLVKDLQATNLRLLASEEKLRQDLISLRKSLGDQDKSP